MENKVMEIYERSLAGKKIKENEFDMSILPSRLNELIRKYDIRYPPGEAVAQDMEMAKRVFEAAVELLIEIGIFCQDTGKLIEIEREEIIKVLKNAGTSHVLGRNSNSVTCNYRSPNDIKPPVIIGGACGTPISEDTFLDIMTSYANEDIDALHTGSLQSYKGKRIKINAPVEIMAARQEGLWAREAVRKARKPDLALMGVMSGITSESQSAADFDEGFRPSDVHLLTFPNDLKVNWSILKKIIHNHHQGNLLYGCTILMLGGYSGGPEGTAITGVASAIQSYLLARPHSFAVGTILLGGKVRDVRPLWVTSMVPLAFYSAGYRVMLDTYIGAIAGPCTEMICDELSAIAMAFTASGFSAINGGGANLGSMVDHATGMESRIIIDVSRAAAGLTLEQANSLVTELVKKIQGDGHEGKGAPKGKKFSECYDTNLAPSAEYLKLWENKKRDLEKLGLKGIA